MEGEEYRGWNVSNSGWEVTNSGWGYQDVSTEAICDETVQSGPPTPVQAEFKHKKAPLQYSLYQE
eukprot:135159-Rhodomonas_salina.6